METELAPGVAWDDEKPLHKQSEAVQSLIDEAMSQTAIHREYEPCLEGRRRTVVRHYQLTDTMVLVVSIDYNTGPLEPGFMGIADFTYTFTN